MGPIDVVRQDAVIPLAPMTLGWLADVRWRLAEDRSLCPFEHTIHRSDDQRVVWITCDGPDRVELDRLRLPDHARVSVSADAVQQFVLSTTAQHERKVGRDVIRALLEAHGG